MKRGALVHLISREGKFYIKSSSNPGDVKVFAHGLEYGLLPGQEIMLTWANPEEKDLSPPDGIGRRNQDVRHLPDGATAVVSDFSMITLISNLSRLRTTTEQSDRKIREQMMKTAAAIDTITHGYGNYRATPKASAKQDGSQDGRYATAEERFKPVSYRSTNLPNLYIEKGAQLTRGGK